MGRKNNIGKREWEKKCWRIKNNEREKNEIFSSALTQGTHLENLPCCQLDLIRA